jgi:hypothetical protein
MRQRLPNAGSGRLVDYHQPIIKRPSKPQPRQRGPGSRARRAWLAVREIVAWAGVQEADCSGGAPWDFFSDGHHDSTPVLQFFCGISESALLTRPICATASNPFRGAPSVAHCEGVVD